MEEEPTRSAMELQVENETLRSENALLKSEVEILTQRLAEIEKRLSKNSQNSQLPQSSDLFGRNSNTESPNRKVRHALGKKPGKEPGTHGKHLSQKVDPDEVVLQSPLDCSSCGSDIFGASVQSIETRQVFDTPKPTLTCIKHRSERRRCWRATTTAGVFPRSKRVGTLWTEDQGQCPVSALWPAYPNAKGIGSDS